MPKPKIIREWPDKMWPDRRFRLVSTDLGVKDPCLMVEHTNWDAMGQEFWESVSGPDDKKNRDYCRATWALLHALVHDTTIDTSPTEE